MDKKEIWMVGEKGGMNGPFYSVVSSTGRVIAMQIPDKEIAEMIASIPQMQKASMCPVCGGENGKHRRAGGTVAKEPFTVDDWRALYEFLEGVELPFVHGLIAHARARLPHPAPDNAAKGQENNHNHDNHGRDGGGGGQDA